MRTLTALALIAAITTPAAAHDPSLSDRAVRFYSSIQEKADELNCRPAVCRAKAGRLGLIWHEEDFRVCDASRPTACVWFDFGA